MAAGDVLSPGAAAPASPKRRAGIGWEIAPAVHAAVVMIDLSQACMGTAQDNGAVAVLPGD